MATATVEKVKYVFQLLGGVHSTGTQKNNTRKIYRARRMDDPPSFRGDIIETETDLSRLNKPGFPPRFKQLAGPGTDVSETLGSMERRPGETSRQFAARLAELARIAAEQAEMDDTDDVKQSIRAGQMENLDGMTVEELKGFAADNGVELGKVKSKDEIKKRIREAMATGPDDDDDDDTDDETARG